MTLATCITNHDASRIPRVALEHVSLAVGRLDKSIVFYQHVLGFRVVADGRHEREPCVIMAAPGQARLALREERRLNSAASDVTRHPARRLSLLVDDLDEARASLWDHGVPLARGTREPDAAGPAGRSLFVDDPDGHRIELVEISRPLETGAS